MSNLLALDQSSRTTGYAIYKNGKLDNYGKFTLEDEDIGLRLVKFRDKIIQLLHDYEINEVAFEEIQM